MSAENGAQILWNSRAEPSLQLLLLFKEIRSVGRTLGVRPALLSFL